MGKIKKFIFVIYLIVLIGSILFEAYIRLSYLNFSISPFIYWLLLFGWVWVVSSNKIKSFKSLYIGLILYVVASFLTLLGLENIAETIFRISFLGWLIGIVQALVEYKKNK